MKRLFAQCLAWAGSPRVHRFELLAIFALVVAIRIIAVLILPRLTLDPDVYEYQYLADHLARTGHYGFAPDWHDNPKLQDSATRYMYDDTGSARAPGYPAVLAVAGLLLGPGERTRDLLLAAAEGLTAVLAFLIGTFLFGAVAGRIAAALYLINPASVANILWGGRESLVALSFTLGLYLLLRSAVGSPWYAAAAGICLGLGALVKDTLVAVAGLGTVWLVFLAFRHGKRMLLRAVLTLLLAALTCLPWIGRNSLAYHRWAPLSTGGWQAVWLGIVYSDWPYIAEEGTDYVAGLSSEERLRLDPKAASDALEADERLREVVRIRAARDPLGVALAMVRNAVLFWSPVSKIFMDFGFKARPQEAISMIYYGICFVLAVAGLWMFRRRPETLLAIILLAGLTALHSVTFSVPRYRSVFDAVPLVFASGVLAAIWRRRGGAAPA